MKMMSEGKLHQDDYNYPIVQFYRFEQSAYMRGAEKQGKMAVEYAIVVKVEFIPEGCERGPVKPIYFKMSWGEFLAGLLWINRLYLVEKG